MLTYGHEIATSTLTLDEERFAAGARGADNWITEGRWSMTPVHALVPSMILPAASTVIGLA